MVGSVTDVGGTLKGSLYMLASSAKDFKGHQLYRSKQKVV